MNLHRNTEKNHVSNLLKRCENVRACLTSTCYKCASTQKRKRQWGRRRYVTMSVARGEGGRSGWEGKDICQEVPEEKKNMCWLFWHNIAFGFTPLFLKANLQFFFLPFRSVYLSCNLTIYPVQEIKKNLHLWSMTFIQNFHKYWGKFLMD